MSQRLLAALQEQAGEAYVYAYINALDQLRMRGASEQFQGYAENPSIADLGRLAHALQELTLGLERARLEVLATAPNARQYTSLCRAVQPGVEVIIPRRYWQPPTGNTLTIDIDALEMALWASGPNAPSLT